MDHAVFCSYLRLFCHTCPNKEKINKQPRDEGKLNETVANFG